MDDINPITLIQTAWIGTDCLSCLTQDVHMSDWTALEVRRLSWMPD